MPRVSSYLTLLLYPALHFDAGPVPMWKDFSGAYTQPENEGETRNLVAQGGLFPRFFSSYGACFFSLSYASRTTEHISYTETSWCSMYYITETRVMRPVDLDIC